MNRQAKHLKYCDNGMRRKLNIQNTLTLNHLNELCYQFEKEKDAIKQCEYFRAENKNTNPNKRGI